MKNLIQNQYGDDRHGFRELRPHTFHKNNFGQHLLTSYVIKLTLKIYEFSEKSRSYRIFISSNKFSPQWSTNVDQSFFGEKCCDTTPYRCQKGSCLTILFRLSYNASPSSKSRVGGIPGPEAYHKK